MYSPVAGIDVIPSSGRFPSAGWYATPTQVGMLPQRRLLCYSNGCYVTPMQQVVMLLQWWFVTPTQVGMLLQQRLVRYSSESAKLLMMYGFVKFNKTMVRGVQKHRSNDDDLAKRNTFLVKRQC
jgi:hypothetical protein